MAPHRVEFCLPFGAVCAELDGEFAEMEKMEIHAKDLYTICKREKEV